MAYAVKDPAFRQGYGILEIPAVDPVHINTGPVLRLMVEGKIIHKMDAAQQKIKAFVFGKIRGQGFKFPEIADFQAESDPDRELLLPDPADQVQVVLQFQDAGLPVEPRVDILTVRAHGIVHGNKLFKTVAVLQQADLIDLHFHGFIGKLPDPVQGIGTALNMNMAVSHRASFAASDCLPISSSMHFQSSPRIWKYTGCSAGTS